jgi:hypothetical protein
MSRCEFIMLLRRRSNVVVLGARATARSDGQDRRGGWKPNWIEGISDEDQNIATDGDV